MQAAPAPMQHQSQSAQDGNNEPGPNKETASPAPKDGEAGSVEPVQASAPASTGGRRGGRSATMGSDEWSRQRKDNHVRVV